MLPASVAAGTLTWLTIVSAGSAFARRYAGERALRVVSTVAAVAIAAFGVLFIAGGVRAIT